MREAMTEHDPLAKGLLTIHAIITRGLSVSLDSCTRYGGDSEAWAREAAGFKMFVSALRAVLHSHHLAEDEIMFPYFRDRLGGAPFDRLLREHEKMAALLEAIAPSERKITPGATAASELGEIRELLGDIDSLWGPHIAVEEESFSAEKLHAVVAAREQRRLVRSMESHGKDHAGPVSIVLPFLFYNLDGADRAAFQASFPRVLTKVLVPLVWRNLWKPMRPFLLV